MNNFLLGCVTGCLLLVAVSSAQNATSDRFIGTWKLNTQKTQQFIGSKPVEETLVIKPVDAGQDYSMDIRNPDGTWTKTRYKVKYNDGVWHESIDGNTGKPSGGHVMIVKVDDRTQYRITRNARGEATGVMMRRMDATDNSYTAYNMNVEGKLVYARVFERQ
jgi:hypothetical protein